MSEYKTLNLTSVHSGVQKRRLKRRVGRGVGSGQGKTGGRGSKGQYASAGARLPGITFVGGQTPLFRRVPKRGFSNARFKNSANVVNVGDLDIVYNDGDVVDAASLRGLSSHLTVDLGEVRGFAYYTGPIFHIFAAGPGESIGSGGRYDDLLRRFGAPMPAVGFALDLDRLSAALRTAGVALALPDRVVVVGEPDDARVASLRAKGTCAVAVRERSAAMAYARAWGFSHVLDAGDGAALEQSHLTQ